MSPNLGLIKSTDGVTLVRTCNKLKLCISLQKESNQDYICVNLVVYFQ